MAEQIEAGKLGYEHLGMVLRTEGEQVHDGEKLFIVSGEILRVEHGPIDNDHRQPVAKVTVGFGRTNIPLIFYPLDKVTIKPLE